MKKNDSILHYIKRELKEEVARMHFPYIPEMDVTIVWLRCLISFIFRILYSVLENFL